MNGTYLFLFVFVVYVILFASVQWRSSVLSTASSNSNNNIAMELRQKWNNSWIFARPFFQIVCEGVGMCVCVFWCSVFLGSQQEYIRRICQIQKLLSTFMHFLWLCCIRIFFSVEYTAVLWQYKMAKKNEKSILFNEYDSQKKNTQYNNSVSNSDYFDPYVTYIPC